MLVVAALMGCGDLSAEGGALFPTMAIRAVTPTLVLPGTQLVVEAEGLVAESVASYRLTLVGSIGDRGVAIEVPATLEAGGALVASFDRTVDGALDGAAALEGGFAGVVELRRDIGGAVAVARAPVVLSFARALTPALVMVADGGALYPGDRVAIDGAGLLLPGEGTTLLELDGAFTAAPPAGPRAIAGLVVPVEASRATGRTRGGFELTPDLLGVRPGRFEGRARLVNAHLAAEVVASPWQPIGPFTLEPPVIDEVAPRAVSRGQRFTVHGRGLVPPDGLAEVVTLLVLEGLFTPRRGPATAHYGVDAIIIYPEAHRGNTELDAILPVAIDPDGGLLGLGARAGVFEGSVIPLVLSGADAVEGPPLDLELTVTNPRQVVHVQLLPGFADALGEFGLAAERAAVEARILEAVRRDYAGINITFTTERPEDFAEYAVVEVGGRDPNGQGLFGLDNTAGKDVGNLRLDDVIGGFNAETRAGNNAAYGGIFVAELMAFSPTLSEHELASPRFDAIFGPFAPSLGGVPATPGESGGGGPRAAAVDEAARVLGSLVASTITHEVGHTLGLTAIDRRIHNDGDNPGWIMDAGRFRPFEERAEIDGAGPEVFSPFNREYLLSVLPPDNL